MFFLLLESTESHKSKVLTDIEMTPNELEELARKRRMILSHERLQRRAKRSSATYDLYETNPVNKISKKSISKKVIFFF